jgi:hypothetical protein
MNSKIALDKDPKDMERHCKNVLIGNYKVSKIIPCGECNKVIHFRPQFWGNDGTNF